MTLREEASLCENLKQDMIQLCQKIKQYPLISLFFIFVVLSLLIIPYLQVDHRGINNATVEATLENQYRATFAQILGGCAVLFGLYFTWGNLITARDGQITERFTRAVDQLGAIDKDGNPAIEIRLGGIYALERISTESSKDYWSIMEILTAYVRKNSPNTDIKNKDAHGKLDPKKISFDIQAILTVIRRLTNSFNNGESNSLDLSSSYLGYADLTKVNLAGATLQRANFYGSGLKEAIFIGAILEEVIFEDANLEGTKFQGIKHGSADFKLASLIDAIFIGADLTGADFKEADLQGADFEGAILCGANLKGAKNLTPDQLSEVKTLYKAELDEGLEAELRAKGFGHLLDDEPERDET